MNSFKDALFIALLVILITATVFSLLGFLNIALYPIDPFTSFRPQYLLVGVLSSFVLYRHKGLLCLSLACCALNAPVIKAVAAPYLRPPETSAAVAAGTIKLLVANVLTSNRETEELLTLIKQESPDLVVAIEIDSLWEEELTSLREHLPFAYTMPRADNFGIGIYSKLPVKPVHTGPLGKQQPLSIQAELSLQDRKVSILATHPVPPVSLSYFKSRNAQLRSIADYARGADGDVIVLGDLNVTPWSPFFQHLLKTSGLKDVRAGFGILPTWPSTMPLLLVPIDHILVSTRFAPLEVETKPLPGSDHFALLVTLAY